MHSFSQPSQSDTTKVNALNQATKEFIIKGDYLKADSFAREGLKLAKSLSFKKGIFDAYNHSGVIFWYRDNFPKALQNYFNALKTAEDMHNDFLISRSQANVALVFINQKEYAKALVYYNKALVVKEKMGDKNGIAAILNNIGTIYEEKKEPGNALRYYERSLEVARSNSHSGMIGLDLYSIGGIYFNRGNTAGALENYLEALVVAETIQDKVLIPKIKNKTGDIYIQQKKYAEAEGLLKEALAMSLAVGNLSNQTESNRLLSRLYAQKGNWKLSYKHYKEHTELKDSIYNDTKTKDMVRNEMNFDFDKKQALEKKEQEKKDAITAAELSQQRMQRNYFIAGFILMLVVAIVVFRSYRQKQKANRIIALQKQEVEKQKEIVESQKHILEEHQKEIIDSITYAKRLQEAILPPQDFINSYLPDNFIYYKPKDLVAGDFYWAESINGLFFIAAADSTGHGVPGCMVSVVCSNALNRSVKEFNITDTGKILEKTRELVVETFEKSANEVKDGMDISLLCLDLKTNTITWSGANNPLWYILPEDNTIQEIKADKQPIGKTDHAKAFTTHTIEYEKGMTFYLFTDGYADQFGGEKGKKFKYKQFEKLLQANHGMEIEAQKTLLGKAFDAWKGELEQVDDVCVIGIRL
jgi:serine phosphatase RsbU (regulator of sigma subunit)